MSPKRPSPELDDTIKTSKRNKPSPRTTTIGDRETSSPEPQSSEESSILSSSSEDEDDNKSIPTLTTKQKPTMKPLPSTSREDLEDRLKSFLPALKAANEAILSHKGKGKAHGLEIDQEQEGQEYISMELGLGVLEHKDANHSDSSSSSDGEEDIMARLRGEDKEDREKKKPDIMEIS